MKNILCLILGGGRGANLYPLTKRRSEPAVPIAGKYRLIDIPVSNCLNSGLVRVYVLTQFLSVSLHRHLGNTYKFDPFSRGFVEVLAAQQTNETAGWYQGTADALRQNLRYVQEDSCTEVLILSGDQLYRMDFAELVKTHRDSGADITMAVNPVTREQAGRMGIVRLDAQGRIVELVEKPQSEVQLKLLQRAEVARPTSGVIDSERPFLANMGIYLFKRAALFDLLNDRPLAADLVNDLFVRNLHTRRINTFLFGGYWDDLGSIKSYLSANLALAGENPPFDFHTPQGVIFTRMRNLPSARITAAKVDESLISDGCIVEAGTTLKRCVLGVRSRIGRSVTMTDTILLGADRIETESERTANRSRGLPDLGIGEGAVIQRAIIDKDTRVGKGVRIVNSAQAQHLDGDNFVIRDGIVVIPTGAVLADGTVI